MHGPVNERWFKFGAKHPAFNAAGCLSYEVASFERLYHLW